MESDLQTRVASQEATICVRLGSLFSPSECENIVNSISTLPREVGKVWDDDIQQFVVDVARRRVTTWYFERTPALVWIYKRLDAAFNKAGELLGAPLLEVREPAKLMCYQAGDHFNSWHTDSGPGYAVDRALSLSVELSARSRFCGGRLQVLAGGKAKDVPVQRGDAAVFRSGTLHRVTPVTVGERWSLVNWASLRAIQKVELPKCDDSR